MLHKIIIRGARANNLKNVDIDIPHNKLVIFTGLSGSGKSSLAFDTIYAEGQRRFMESLSSFTKQFMENLDKPDVDHIDGLPPTIAINQRTSSASPRSTVGTATEIYDYLRLLFSRIGIVHCPTCGTRIIALTKQQIVNEITALLKKKNGEAFVFAPLIKNEKIANLDHIINELTKLNYHAVRFDGSLLSLRELESLPIDLVKKHTLDIAIERIAKTELDHYDHTQLVNAIKQALEYGDGTLLLSFPSLDEELIFTENLVCFACDVTIPDIEPRNFSFNNPAGACQSCTGLGYLLKLDPELLIPNKKLTVAQGAIQPLNKMYTNTNHYISIIEKAVAPFGFTINTPIQDLSEKQLSVLLFGDEKSLKPLKGKEIPDDTFIGIIPFLEKKYRETDSEYVQRELEEYMRIFQCHACKGKRLRPEMLAITVAECAIDHIVGLSIVKLIDFFHSIDGEKTKKSPLSPQEQKIAKPIIREALKRTHALIDVGLGYLILDRSMTTLSGGEAQRVKLANHISSSLMGVVYVLDEPSIGLHPKDTEQLIETLIALRDAGNTVLVVEHDKSIMKMGDMIVDVGPRAGKNGGHIVAQGTVQEIMKQKNSLTGKYLTGELTIAIPKKPSKGKEVFLTIVDAYEFNLKHITVAIPLSRLVVVTGLSGSGKSTLIIEILSKALTKKFYRTKDEPGAHKEIKGLEHIDKVVVIDQSPIGRTPRSNPATYTNLFTPIRELYTELPEAKIKGFKAGHFSFNVKGGRCETCQGEGMVRIDMRFLSDVYVECRDCHGKRYTKEALEVHYEGMSIADILDMTVDEAFVFFQKHTVIHDKLKTLSDVGLGYIKLGQAANTLSGGEAQRMKLASELSRRSTGKTLYILDEPTTGLHFEDIKQLLNILNQLVEKGNTVLIIEHNMDVIKNADWIIDLGPEGGEKGGEIVAQGTPADIVKVTKSWTGKYLKEIL